ncbi:MAG: hypothetical protein KIT16_21345 [Rhodospirillaceae bacterium]|nr:hypothetical protein [Rhodospirillaceae bacterium]
MRKRLAALLATLAALGAGNAAAEIRLTAAGHAVDCKPRTAARYRGAFVSCTLARPQLMRIAGDVRVPCMGGRPIRFDEHGALVTCWSAGIGQYFTGDRQLVICRQGEQLGFAANGALILCAPAERRVFATRGQRIACAPGRLVGFTAAGALTDCLLADPVSVATRSGQFDCAPGRIDFSPRTGNLKSCVLAAARTLTTDRGQTLRCRAGGNVYFNEESGRFTLCNI